MGNMVGSRYKNFGWYRCLRDNGIEELYKMIDDAHDIIDKQPYNAANSIRGFWEHMMDYIGRKENIPSLREGGKNDKDQDARLVEKINILYERKIINKRTKDRLTNIRKTCNEKLHHGRHGEESLVQISNVFYETCIVAKSIVARYFDLSPYEELMGDDLANDGLENKKKEKTIYICSNKTQCGRRHKDNYAYDCCTSCGAPIEKIIVPIKDDEIQEEGIATPVEFDQSKAGDWLKVYILDESTGCLREFSEIKLEDDEIILGRKSSTSTPDIDLCEYILNADYKASVSKKHMMIYKKNDSYYLRDLSDWDSVQIKEDGQEQRVLEYQETVRLKHNTVIGITTVALKYIKR